MGTGRLHRKTHAVLQLFRHPGAAFIFIVLLSSILIPKIFSAQYLSADLYRRNLLPAWASAQGQGLLGTDAAGRDLFLQIVSGAKTSMLISFSVVLLACIIGVAIGIAAAMSGRTMGSIIMRWVDGFMSFPGLLLVLIILYIFGPGVAKIVFVMALLTWPGYARIAYSDALQARNTAYVQAARLSGVGRLRIARSYVFPTIVRPVTALAAIQVGGVIIGESGLSFLGLGVQAPDVSLGLIVSQGHAYFPGAWNATLFPGVLIALSAAALNSWVAHVSRVIDPVSAAHVRTRKREAILANVREIR